MRFGYAFWGFLADRKFENGKEVSTPDGNAAYSWSILWEAQKRGWQTWLLQKDRDKEYVNGRLVDAFTSFSPACRFSAWQRANKTITTGNIELWNLDDIPDLDVVLIEWRFPIPGRNVDVSVLDENYQPDYDRQMKLLTHFKEKGTKIILWDLDHKLTIEDEQRWQPDAIFETSVQPLSLSQDRIRVEPPVVINELLQFETVPQKPNRKLVYVGSRYERDDVIEEWIKPFSEWHPFEVEFWGNWTREPNLTECREMWPNILYNRRITMNDFKEVYQDAVACPLLAKKSYFKSGFITPRPWEALMFGTIPVGLEPHLGVEDYTLFVARDSDDLIDIVDYLSQVDLKERHELRVANIDKISFMDAMYFVDKIEKVANE